MSAFRLYSRIDTFNGLTGQLLANGWLTFCEAGTTTPANVYGEIGLTTNNGSTVQLDSSGRPDVDVWGDGAYFVELFDAQGVKQGEADDVQNPSEGGLSIPALAADQFLTNNGALMQWAEIRQMPDPTGQDGKYPVADGSGYILVSPPVPPTPPAPLIAVTATSVSLDDAGTAPNKFLIQTGTGSAPASGGRDTSGAVVFPVAFGTLLHVGVTPQGTGFPGDIPRQSMAAQSAAGFTIAFKTGENSTSGVWDINSPIPFTWVAFGIAV